MQDLSDDDIFVFSSLLSRMEQRDYCTKLINFKENLAQRSDLPRCWLKLLEVIEIFFNLICATRSGNWPWYVNSVRNTLPCFLHMIELIIADI